MNEIMSGEATSAQIAAFAIALRAKGETVDEVAGLVGAMYDHATKITVPGRTVDVVGTGGDRAHTVNISTMAALTTAGAGARVVKHGNRAHRPAGRPICWRSSAGLTLPPVVVALVAGEVGITFCFAPSIRLCGMRRPRVARSASHDVPLPRSARQPGPAAGGQSSRMNEWGVWPAFWRAVGWQPSSSMVTTDWTS
jgi:anthranilate phosphoribosyltransferase